MDTVIGKHTARPTDAEQKLMAPAVRMLSASFNAGNCIY